MTDQLSRICDAGRRIPAAAPAALRSASSSLCDSFGARRRSTRRATRLSVERFAGRGLRAAARACRAAPRSCSDRTSAAAARLLLGVPSASASCCLLLRLFLLQRFGDRIAFGSRLLVGFGAPAASARSGGGGVGSAAAVLISCFSATFGVGVLDRLRSAIFSTSGFGVVLLGRGLHARRHLRELGRRDDVDRQRLRSAWPRAACAANETSPHSQQRGVHDRRYRQAGLHRSSVNFTSPARPRSPARRGGSPRPRAVPSPASPCRSPPSCRRAHRCARRCRRAPR